MTWVGNVRVIEDVLRAIDLFQDCAGSDSDVATALAELADCFAAASATFEVVDRPTRRLVARADARIDPAAMQAYARHYHAISPRVAYGLRTDAKPVLHDGDLLSEEEMARDAFYNEFLAPLDLKYFLSIQIDPDPDTFAVLAFQFSPRHGMVEPRKLGLAAAMRPLLSRALQRRWTRSADHDASAICRDLRGRFGLTPAESALALALYSGVPVAEYAEWRDISRNTAYTHYARLKVKLGCRRQIEVTRRLHALYPTATFAQAFGSDALSEVAKGAAHPSNAT